MIEPVSHCLSLLPTLVVNRRSILYAILLSSSSTNRFGGLPPRGQGRLIDVGAGTGRCLFLSACLYPWLKCTGIEIYEPRAKLANQAIERWNSYIAAASSSDISSSSNNGDATSSVDPQSSQKTSSPSPPAIIITDIPETKDLDFITGDVIEYGVGGYDVILLVSAAFTDFLLSQIAQVLDPCPIGTLVSSYKTYLSIYLPIYLSVDPAYLASMYTYLMNCMTDD